MVRKLLGAATWVGLFLVGTVLPLHAQFLSFGVKGGIPLTDPLTTEQGSSGGITHDVRRYVVGATGEVHLPLGLSLEVDALYRSLNYTVFTGNFSNAVSSLSNSGSDWQFPILAKYQFRQGVIVHPFVDAGLTFRHVNFSNVPLADPNTAGVTVGGGLTLRFFFLRLSPEIRYTHFPTDVFGSNFNFIHSDSNQVDFLVGLTF